MFCCDFFAAYCVLHITRQYYKFQAAFVINSSHPLVMLVPCVKYIERRITSGSVKSCSTSKY